MRASADLHVGNLDFGEILPVPTVAAIPGPAGEPENADLHVLAVARDQHLVERHFVARLRIEQRDLDRDSRLGAELAAAGGENGITHRAGRLIGTWNWVKEPGFGSPGS